MIALTNGNGLEEDGQVPRNVANGSKNITHGLMWCVVCVGLFLPVHVYIYMCVEWVRV